MAVLIKTRRDGGASYASISVVAPVLASSRFRENPRSFRPFLSPRPSLFSLGSLCETLEFLQPNLQANHHHRRRTDTRRAANLPILPSWDSRKPPRRVHSFSDLSPRRLARSWITGFLAFLPLLLSLFLPSRGSFYSSFRRVLEISRRDIASPIARGNSSIRF